MRDPVKTGTMYTEDQQEVLESYTHAPRYAIRQERWGGSLMARWDGEGAARVMAQDEHTFLLERATGRRSLADMVRNGDDHKASRIICAVITRLHAKRRPN